MGNEIPALFFGIKRENYKPWKLFDGTPVLVPGDFNVEIDDKGNWLLHERGDLKAPVVGKMPKDGYYFDDLTLIRSSGGLQYLSLDNLREHICLEKKK